MTNVFITADTHFGHRGVCKFLRNDGVTPLRPWDDPDEMDEAMIQNWNAVVKPTDKVYHLGDVVMNRRKLHTLYRLNGTKVLIKGNHDIFRLDEYAVHFKDVRAYHVLGGLIMSHIPIHFDNMERFGVNIHGHLHANKVMKGTEPDPRYLCVSVEHTNFTPLAFEDLKKLVPVV